MPDYFGMDTRRLFSPPQGGTSAAAQGVVVNPPFMSGVAYDMFGPILPDADIQQARTIAMRNRDLAEAEETAKARLAHPRMLGAGINLDSPEAIDREVWSPFRNTWSPRASAPVHFYDTAEGIVRADPNTGKAEMALGIPKPPRMKSAAEMAAANASDKVLQTEDQKATEKLRQGIGVDKILMDHPVLLQNEPFASIWEKRLKDYREDKKSGSPSALSKEYSSLVSTMANAERAGIPVSPFVTNRINEISGLFQPEIPSPTVTTNKIVFRQTR